MAHHREGHKSVGTSWLRAAVLGANDGIVSIGSLVVGVVAADLDGAMVAGMAGLVGGALSMAVGEYVSVASQRDAERADVERERWELQHEPEDELTEMALIWEGRGLDAGLARQVAQALHDHDALGAHLRDELGITELSVARPLEAAAASAIAFSIGGALPMVTAVAVSGPSGAPWIGAACLAALILLGVVSARLGGARPMWATARVVGGGALAMGITYGIGQWVGVAV